MQKILSKSKIQNYSTVCERVKRHLVATDYILWKWMRKKPFKSLNILSLDASPIQLEFVKDIFLFSSKSTAIYMYWQKTDVVHGKNRN
jgi:hypothetical protein